MNTKINFSIILPATWEELSTEKRTYVYFLLSEGYSPDKIRTFCLLRWSGIRVVGAQGNHRFMVQYEGNYGILSAAQLDAAGQALKFLDTIPQIPYLPEVINGHRHLSTDLRGVPFETFLALENFYQGFLQTQNPELIKQMAAVLYQSKKVKIDSTQTIAVFYWFASLKQVLRNRFSHFFQPLAADGSGNLLGTSPDMSRHLQESMDAQIRALTKGDVTKETEVLQLDTWRALTELNAQAKEFEELRKNNK